MRVTSGHGNGRYTSGCVFCFFASQVLHGIVFPRMRWMMDGWTAGQRHHAVYKTRHENDLYTRTRDTKGTDLRRNAYNRNSRGHTRRVLNSALDALIDEHAVMCIASEHACSSCWFDTGVATEDRRREKKRGGGGTKDMKE